ncbi:MAG: ATP-binding protein [bacterium]|nr:ATP-binding protein [bacterium]MDZ4285766.1 ATP-binding protein [Candidatus Sungbacteria bacterium]
MFLALNADIFLLGIAVAATGILGFVIFLNEPNNYTNRAFLIFSTATILWAIANFFNHQIYSLGVSFFLYRLTIFFATWHAFSLFYLLYTFPKEKVFYPRWFTMGILPVVGATLILTLTSFVFQDIKNISTDGQITEIHNGPGIILFALVVAALIFGGIYILYRKMRQAKDQEKRQFKIILGGILGTFALLLLFNFILPAFFDNARFLPFGPIFFFPLILSIFYIITRHNFLNIRIVSTEILVFVLSVAVLFEVLIATDPITLAFRSSLFILVLTLGILLIRSVRGEVSQRERMQHLALELNNANKELRRLDQTKSEFISIASHQLRAPLTVIKGYLSLAIEGTLGEIAEKAKESLGHAAFATDQLNKLVNELLNLSRIESGKIQYTFAANNLNKIIIEVAEELKSQATNKGVSLRLKLDGNLAQFIFDRDKMREIVINYIHNAIKYTPKGNVDIRSEMVKKTTGEFVRFSVADQGMGIDKEDISRLFGKFIRTDQAKVSDPNGMGLGLYFVKKVAEDHGGSAWAESPGINKGSTFIIEIPFKQ